jgi:hypothetical protein
LRFLSRRLDRGAPSLRVFNCQIFWIDRSFELAPVLKIKVAVCPLFVAITPGMDIVWSDQLGGGDEGGGPKRSTEQEFAITRDVMRGPRPA